MLRFRVELCGLLLNSCRCVGHKIINAISHIGFANRSLLAVFVPLVQLWSSLTWTLNVEVHPVSLVWTIARKLVPLL